MTGGHLQTFLHSQCLSVIVHIDDIFPLSLCRLPSLRLGVLDLGGTEKSSLLSEVSLVVRVVLRSPVVPVVMTVVVAHFLV